MKLPQTKEENAQYFLETGKFIPGMSKTTDGRTTFFAWIECGTYHWVSVNHGIVKYEDGLNEMFLNIHQGNLILVPTPIYFEKEII